MLQIWKLIVDLKQEDSLILPTAKDPYKCYIYFEVLPSIEILKFYI